MTIATTIPGISTTKTSTGISCPTPSPNNAMCAMMNMTDSKAGDEFYHARS